MRSAVLEFMTNFDTARYDQYVFEIDRRLFGSPSFATRQFLNGHQWLWWPVAHAYDNLARIVVLLLFWFLWTQPIEDVWLYIRSLVINPFLAVLVYVMFPVSGPIYAFKNFPELPSADLIPHVIHLAARPNCIPSVHMSSAILLFWLVRKWIVGRIFGLAFLVLTVLATLGSGEHYFFDLMLAVPHTALVFWLSGYSVRAREATISLPQESAPAA